MRALFIVLLGLSLVSSGQAEDLKSIYQSLNRHDPQAPVSVRDDYLRASGQAVGIQDRGRVQNVFSNFGILSNLHLFTPAVHFPNTDVFVQQYSAGVNFLVGVKGDVISSVFNPQDFVRNYEWQPASRNLFSGDRTASDGTPLLASSDDELTWPRDASDQPFWPGRYRLDEEGTPVAGEFVSERDIYAVFTDQGNERGSYGLEVELTAYSFNRPILEDALIFDFYIHNRSDTDLDSVVIGYLVDLKPDYDFKDILFDYRHLPNHLIYEQDFNQTPDGNWEEVALVGFGTLPTPQTVSTRIQNFHYFDDVSEPADDGLLWRLMTSDRASLPDSIAAKYFHGEDVKYDDTSLSPLLDPSGNGEGTDVTFIVSSGLLSIAAGDSVRSTVVILLAETANQMIDHFEFLRERARDDFRSSTAPPVPALYGVAGDGRVTLTWDRVAESAIDPLTEQADFEGYRLYRSTDQGTTWGEPVTNSRGRVIDYVPLAQFDLDNEVFGTDPVSGLYLGNNSGLTHVFIDSTVVNGIEYWYTLTAYDNGLENVPEGSLSSPRGVFPQNEKQIIAVTPGGLASDIRFVPVNNSQPLEPLGGICDGTVIIEVVDPAALLDQQYTLTFDIIDDTTTVFNLIAMPNDTLLKHYPVLESPTDFVPIINGFRPIVIDTEFGVISAEWTYVHHEQTTFDWWFEQRTNSNEELGPVMYGYHNYRITVGDETTGEMLPAASGIDGLLCEAHVYETVWIPLRVEAFLTEEEMTDVTSYCGLLDLRYYFPQSSVLSPQGWDLIPGGKAYNPTALADQWADRIVLKNGPTCEDDEFWMGTQHPPEELGGIPPSPGDQFTIITAKPFRETVYYQFETQKARPTESGGEPLSAIKVVPNPYIVSSDLANNGIMFTHLPSKCTIHIFTVAGDKVTQIDHQSQSDTAYWDLRNSSGREVAYGLYVYVVETPQHGTYTGKFYIIR
ncbi:MAG: hypothetical protein D6675_01485 [Gemmatimonadetes bacterium]|nr:MAG: hypothetical protein D6675_01485 [Gemmatimonadota bacterium]